MCRFRGKLISRHVGNDEVTPRCHGLFQPLHDGVRVLGVPDEVKDGHQQYRDGLSHVDERWRGRVEMCFWLVGYVHSRRLGRLKSDCCLGERRMTLPRYDYGIVLV